jgi:type VI protein secretion system component Hcp
MHKTFAKVTGCPGSSKALGFEGQWDIGPVDISASNMGSFGQSGGGNTTRRGKPAGMNLNVVMCKGTTQAFKKLVAGEVVSEVVISSCKTINNKLQVFQELTFTNVYFTNFGIGGASEAGLPTANMSFEYEKLAMKHTPIDSKGNKGAAATFTWGAMDGKMS